MSSTAEERAERKRAYGRAYSKRYYAANRERALEYAKNATWKPNLEQRRAYQKKYAETHREKVRAKDKICNKNYRDANLERVRARDKAYAAANREKRSEKHSEWYGKNREKLRSRRLAKYGITHWNYVELCTILDHACQICGAKAENERDGVLHVDHDHSTIGEFRGLLCSRCNLALGGFRDDPDLLRVALSYLEKGLHRMSVFTAADLRLGGRLQAACDAIGAGHLRVAAGILNELAEELNVEAESTDGLMAEDPVEWPLETNAMRVLAAKQSVEAPTPTLAVKGQPVDLQSCSRNVHSYGAPDSNGWRTCSSCGNVNVAPPDGGTVDMSARPLGDYA